MSGSLTSGMVQLILGDSAAGWRALCCVTGHGCPNSVLHNETFSDETADPLPCTSVAVLSQNSFPAPE